MELVVSDRAGIAALRAGIDRAAVRRIRLAGRLADDRAERQLNAAYFACGCGEGSIAVSLTLIVCLAAGLLHGFDDSLDWWRILLYLATAAVAGKIAGLVLARVRLRRLLHRLSSSARPTGDHG